MLTTAKGYPYPDPLDSVSDGDLVIKALAQFLEANGFKAMHAGKATATFSASAVASTGSIAYPVGKFTAEPAILACVGSGVSMYAAIITASTAAAFTAAVRRIDGTNVSTTVSVYWLAVQLA